MGNVVPVCCNRGTDLRHPVWHDARRDVTGQRAGALHVPQGRNQAGRSDVPAGGAARADQWTVRRCRGCSAIGALARAPLRKGIDFQFGYATSSEPTQGGVRRWAGYSDQTQAGATFNLERLFGVKDAIFKVTYTERTGRNLVIDAQLNATARSGSVGTRPNRPLDAVLVRPALPERFISRKPAECRWAEISRRSAATIKPHVLRRNIGNLVGNYIFNWPISQWAGTHQVQL